MSEQVFQSRYVAYARMHGKGPQEMIDLDNTRGGIGVWFTAWIQGRWAEFDKLTDRRCRIGSGHSEAGHRLFDRWLDDNCVGDPNTLSDD